MSSTRKGNHKCAVLLVRTPDDWHPTHLHAVPLEITAARFYVRRVSLSRALAVAQELNRAALPCNGRFTHEWAMVSYSLKLRAGAAMRALGDAPVNHGRQEDTEHNAELVRHIAQRFADFSFQLKRFAERLGDGVVATDLHALMVATREAVNALPERKGGAA